MTFRVGQGFDVHPFGGAGPLVLAGIVVQGQGLQGHSDADVASHAVCDALLGAAGLGDIGTHFPDTDPAYRGAASTELVGSVVAKLADAGWHVGNVDLTLILEAPRLAPHRAAMEERLSSVVGAPVSVKAKRAEGLGSIGRAEGIACFAVALIER